MALEIMLTRQKKQPPECSAGEMISSDTFYALSRVAAAGGRVSMNGVSMSTNDLLMLAEAVRAGATFCLIKQKSDEHAELSN